MWASARGVVRRVRSVVDRCIFLFVDIGFVLGLRGMGVCGCES